MASRRRQAEVELGPYTYTIVPQKLGRLRHALNEAFDSEAGDEEAEALAKALDPDAESEDKRTDVVAALGGQAHSVLRVFIADLMPLHEWLGYVSEEAREADDYIEAQDRSPDLDQVVYAVEQAMHVNHIDLFKHIRELVSPDFLRAMVQKVIADFLTSNSSSSSLPATADTPTTTSSPSDPTWDPPGEPEATDDGYDSTGLLAEPIGASAG